MRKMLFLLALAAAPAEACTYSPEAFHREKIAYLAVSALDAGTTIYGVERGAREVNPLFGSRPSPARVIGETLVLDVLYTLAINHAYKRDACAAKTAQRIALFVRGGIVGANFRVIF